MKTTPTVPPSLDRIDVGAETLPVVRDLQAMAAAVPLDPHFVQALGTRLRQDAAGRRRLSPLPRRRGGWLGALSAGRAGGRTWGIRVAAVLLVVLLGTGLWTAAPVRAQLQQLACLVPGLGLRACGTGDLVSTAPVTASRGGITVTVSQLLAADRATIVRLEVSGLPTESGSVILLQTRVALRDDQGHTSPATAPFGGAGAATSLPGTLANVQGEWVLQALTPNVRAVDVLLTAPAPLGDWSIPIPVVPIQRAGLPIAQGSANNVTHAGVTVHVASVLATTQETIVQLKAEAPGSFLRSLGGYRWIQPLLLRDDHGRTYTERPNPPSAAPFLDGIFASNVVFPPVPQDVQTAELTLPTVIVAEPGEATATIPLAGKQAGEHIPLDTSVALGGFTFRITGADLVQEQGGRGLALQVTLGGWQAGRKLLRFDDVLVNQHPATSASFLADSSALLQVTQIRVALPPGASTQVRITFRQPQVAIQGPWPLVIPIKKRP